MTQLETGFQNNGFEEGMSATPSIIPAVPDPNSLSQTGGAVLPLLTPGGLPLAAAHALVKAADRPPKKGESAVSENDPDTGITPERAAALKAKGLSLAPGGGMTPQGGYATVPAGGGPGGPPASRADADALTAALARFGGPAPTGGPGGPGGGGFGGGGGPAKMPENYGYTPSEVKQHGLMSDYLGKQGALDKQGAQIGAELEAKKAQALEEAYQQQKQIEAENQAREANRQMWVNSAMAKHEQMAQELANTKIDPAHWFSSKDTGGKIFAVVGMALGGFSDILRSTPKQGPSGMGAVGQNMLQHSRDFSQWMDQMINQDIQIQKMNLDNGYQALNAQRTLFGDRMRAFGDERVAEASAKAAAWQLVNQRVMAMQQQTSSDLAQNNAQKLALTADTSQQNYNLQVAIGAEKAWQAEQARIAQQRAAAASALAKKADERQWELTKMVAHAQLSGQIPNGKPIITPSGQVFVQTPEGQIVPIHKISEGSEKGMANVVMPDGRKISFNAGSPDKSAHLTKGVTELTDYIRNLQKARSMMTGGAFGGGQVSANPYSASRGEWDSISREISVGFKARAQLGSYDAGVERLTGAIIPKPGVVGHFTDADRAKVDSQLQIANAALNNLVSQYGGDPGAGLGPTGGLQLSPVQ